ncbi:MAG: N-acetyltransferase protein [Candidatus Berkelbacteria bacterium]|nr:N-acetyltransferase protein [Candidatus Berkelbacteria bacterium]
MNIRKATINDLKSIQELNSLLLKKEDQDFGQDFDDAWAFSEHGKKCISDRIQNENCISSAVEDSGKVVGYLVGEIREVPPWRKQFKTIELVEIYIIDEYRSKGVGYAVVAGVMVGLAEIASFFFFPRACLLQSEYQ